MNNNIKIETQFKILFHFVSWFDISLGVSINIIKPNIEIHLPFGFFKIGWHDVFNNEIKKTFQFNSPKIIQKRNENRTKLNFK